MFVVDLIVYVWAGFALFWFISEKTNPFKGVWRGEESAEDK
jgi:hypothetical protein